MKSPFCANKLERLGALQRGDQTVELRLDGKHLSLRPRIGNGLQQGRDGIHVGGAEPVDG
jgi:hypothetical protein